MDFKDEEAEENYHWNIGKISLHRNQWCKFHFHISFLSQVTIIGVNKAKPIDTNLST